MHPLWKPVVGALLALVLLSACQSNAAFPTPPLSPPSPTLTVALTSDRITEDGFRVEISLSGSDGRTSVSTFVGTMESIRVTFRPMKDVITTRKDGTVSKYSTDWNAATVSEMRYCTGFGRACSLPDTWVPFAMETVARANVDWFGQKDWAVSAQFRDKAGKLIPAGYSKGEIGSNWLVISSEINDSVPTTSLPPAAQTVVAQVRSTFPVTGTLKINQGQPMGGRTGDTLQVPVEFSAKSPSAPVSEMRTKTDSIGRCFTPEEMQDASWQPYQDRTTFPFKVFGSNWTTFKLHVQFKDSKGNLSTVYCNDIGIEGKP